MLTTAGALIFAVGVLWALGRALGLSFAVVLRPQQGSQQQHSPGLLTRLWWVAVVLAALLFFTRALN